MRILMLTFCAFALITTACGGKKGSSEPDLSSFQKLEQMESNLQKKMDAVVAPIDKVDEIANKLAELPKKFALKADDFKAFILSAVSGDVKVPGGVDATAATELKAFAKDFVDFKELLMATPDKATALVKEVATTLVEAPVLVTKVAAESSITEKNPFASKADKAKAAKEKEGAKALGDKVVANVKGMQTKVTELPNRVTAAIGKFTESLKAVGIGSLSELTKLPGDAAKEATKAVKK